MSKLTYTPPVTEIEEINLEFNLLTSVNASGQNVTWQDSSDFDSLFN